MCITYKQECEMWRKGGAAWFSLQGQASRRCSVYFCPSLWDLYRSWPFCLTWAVQNQGNGWMMRKGKRGKKEGKSCCMSQEVNICASGRWGNWQEVRISHEDAWGEGWRIVVRTPSMLITCSYDISRTWTLYKSCQWYKEIILSDHLDI